MTTLADKMREAKNGYYDEHGPFLPGVEFFAEVAENHYAELVRKVLLSFDWGDFGFDEIDCAIHDGAPTEWVDAFVAALDSLEAS